MAEKKLLLSPERKRQLVEPNHPLLSVRRQCELLGLNRSTLYYEPATESEFNLHLMRLLDEYYLKMPFVGVVKMTELLRSQGYEVNPKPGAPGMVEVARENPVGARGPTSPSPRSGSLAKSGLCAIIAACEERRLETVDRCPEADEPGPREVARSERTQRMAGRDPGYQVVEGASDAVPVQGKR